MKRMDLNKKRVDKKVDKNTGKEIITEYVQMYKII